MKILAHFNDGTTTIVDAPTFTMARITAKDRFPKLHVVHVETYTIKLVEARHG